MIQLVTDPDRFYRRVGRDAPRLGPVAVVALGGIPLVLLDALLAVQGSGGAGAFAGMLGSLASPFVGWLMVGGVFFGLSAVFGGEGGFRRTLRYVGWGFLPSVVSSILIFLVGATVVLGAPAGSFESVQAHLQASPLYRTFESQLSPVFMVWSGFLWTFGVKHARGLDLREAAVTVWVPVGAVVAWMVVL